VFFVFELEFAFVFVVFVVKKEYFRKLIQLVFVLALAIVVVEVNFDIVV